VKTLRLLKRKREHIAVEKNAVQRGLGATSKKLLGPSANVLGGRKSQGVGTRRGFLFTC